MKRIQNIVCYRPVILVVMAAFVAACASSGSPFETMSTEELALHNAGLPYKDQVYCVRERRSGSHLYKNHCATREQHMLRKIRTADQMENITGGSVNVSAF